MDHIQCRNGSPIHSNSPLVPVPGKLVSLLSLAVGQDIYDVRNPLLIWEAANIGKIMGCGMGQGRKGTQKSQKATTVSCKVSANGNLEANAV